MCLDSWAVVNAKKFQLFIEDCSRASFNPIWSCSTLIWCPHPFSFPHCPPHFVSKLPGSNTNINKKLFYSNSIWLQNIIIKIIWIQLCHSSQLANFLQFYFTKNVATKSLAASNNQQSGLAEHLEHAKAALNSPMQQKHNVLESLSTSKWPAAATSQ